MTQEPTPLSEAELEKARSAWDNGFTTYQRLIITIDQLREEAKADDWFRDRINAIFAPLTKEWRAATGKDLTSPGYEDLIEWERERLIEALAAALEVSEEITRYQEWLEEYGQCRVCSGTSADECRHNWPATQVGATDS